MRRNSRHGRLRSCGRATTHSAIDPNRSRNQTTPGGPSVVKSDLATDAPACTEVAAATTSKIALNRCTTSDRTAPGVASRRSALADLLLRRPVLLGPDVSCEP